MTLRINSFPLNNDVWSIYWSTFDDVTTKMFNYLHDISVFYLKEQLKYVGKVKGLGGQHFYNKNNANMSSCFFLILGLWLFNSSHGSNANCYNYNGMR